MQVYFLCEQVVLFIDVQSQSLNVPEDKHLNLRWFFLYNIREFMIYKNNIQTLSWGNNILGYLRNS